MTHKTANTALELRRRAAALKANPIPLLTKTDIKDRWKLDSFETVKRVLTKSRIQPVNPDSAERLLYRLTDILLVEQVNNPVQVWAMGSDDDRELLKTPLLTPGEVKANDTRLVAQHIESIRRKARKGVSGGIKIGKQWRFRADTVTIPDDLATTGNDEQIVQEET